MKPNETESATPESNIVSAIPEATKARGIHLCPTPRSYDCQFSTNVFTLITTSL